MRAKVADANNRQREKGGEINLGEIVGEWGAGEYSVIVCV